MSGLHSPRLSQQHRAQIVSGSHYQTVVTAKGSRSIRSAADIQLIIASKSFQAGARTSQRKQAYPDHMYVLASSATKSGSVFAASVFIFSLIVKGSTGFSLIDPYFSLFGIISATTFFAMATMAEKRACNDRPRP
jgi:hypothetical protein